MPQGAIAVGAFVNPGNSVAPARLGASGEQIATLGGLSSALNLTAAAVIKATPGRLAKIIIVAPGTTSGAFTFNDCATTGAAAASNEVWTMVYNAASNLTGAIFTIDFPFQIGIVLSAVPGAGSPIIAVSYD